MPSADSFQIRDFAPGDQAAFRRLNEAWIRMFFCVEPLDVEILSDPAGRILSPGGAILIAERGGETIGCGALMRLEAGRFEIAKLAVDEASQGLGAGRRLMEGLLARARALGGREVMIETNTRLGPAVALYRSLGFVELPLEAVPAQFTRVDLVLRLALD